MILGLKKYRMKSIDNQHDKKMFETILRFLGSEGSINEPFVRKFMERYSIDQEALLAHLSSIGASLVIAQLKIKNVI